MEQNNGTAPAEQPMEAEIAASDAISSEEQIVTSYGVVSREYVEELLRKNDSVVSKKKKSVGKRILAWFFGIVGGITFLVACVTVCFSVFRFTSGNQISGGNDSFSFDEDFFLIPDFYDDDSEEGGISSGSDMIIDSSQTSDAGLGVVVSALDSSQAGGYGIAGGLVIIGIEDLSAFEGTDVQQYDIITAANGRIITTINELSAVLNKHQPGDELTLTITRFSDGFAESFDVTVILIDKTQLD